MPTAVSVLLERAPVELAATPVQVRAKPATAEPVRAETVPTQLLRTRRRIVRRHWIDRSGRRGDRSRVDARPGC